MPDPVPCTFRRALRFAMRLLAQGGILLPTAAVVIPLLFVLWRAGQPAGESWDQIVEHRLGGYLLHTGILVLAVTVLAVLCGLPAAWAVSVYQFPGRGFFQTALLLPLAMPGFIAALAYGDALQHLVPVYVWIRKNWGVEAFLKSQIIVPWIFATGVLAFTLFPYVFLSCRAVFVRQAAGALEAARTLGAGRFRTFREVAIPMARPAIVAGASLVAMEAVNDYGVVTHFGLVPLTPGIFRAWSQGDLGSAMRLAVILLALMMLALSLEQIQRGRARFASEGDAPARRRKVGIPGMAVAWLVCSVPLVLGFALPAWRLVRWSAQAWETMDWKSNLEASVNSFTLAGGASLLIVAGALLVVGGHRMLRLRPLLAARRIVVMGYAYPSALVAVGTGAMISAFAFQWPGWTWLALSASVTGLVAACFVRYIAVAVQPLAAGFERISDSLAEAARTLGAGRFRALLQIDLPLVIPTLVAGAALAFTDIFKELTMTLVLRPFGFETLSTLAFRLTDEGRIPEAALPGLLIVGLSLLGIVPLTWLMGKESK